MRQDTGHRKFQIRNFLNYKKKVSEIFKFPTTLNIDNHDTEPAEELEADSADFLRELVCCTLLHPKEL
jgi:hypothetical protein